MKAIRRFIGFWKAIAFLTVVFFSVSLTSCQEDIPTVQTISVELLSNGKIQVIGEIISDGGASIQQRGFCFSRHANPTLSDENKIGSDYDYDNHNLFSAMFDNVEPNEECFIRAYAMNEVGVSYGEVLNFKNSAKPLVTTYDAENITKTEAKLKGSVNPLNSETDAWFEYWPKGGTPKIINLPSVSGGEPIEVSVELEGLNISQIYYYVLKVRNGYGENIGDTLQFETYAVNDSDGNLYHIVDINGQVWLKENFRGAHYANGDPIPYISNVEEWKSLTTGAYCWYNHDPKNSKEYGGLYNWYVASDPRGLIVGWHTPKFDEFLALSEFIKNGTLSPSATSLMEAGTNHWLSPCSSPYLFPNNSTGFTALPNGWFNAYDTDAFKEKGVCSTWWGQDYFSDSGNHAGINDCNFGFYAYSHKSLGYGIRLIKD